MTRGCPPHDLQPDTIAALLDAAPTSGEAADIAGIQWLRYQCSLVTPLFGGGVRPLVVDKGMPIRPTALRGQLRFWWRLLARHQRRWSLAEVREREWRVWGGLGSPPVASRVWVRVRLNEDKLQISRLLQHQPGKNYATKQPWEPPSYALFSAPQQTGNDQPELSVAKFEPRDDWHWELALGLSRGGADGLSDDECALIQEAVRWWASFGGIGARTRRGLGAVEVKRLDASGAQLLPPVSVDEAQQAGCRLKFMGLQFKESKLAWAEAIEALKKFRQGKHIGRNPGQNDRPGRSRWPEADAIRRLSGQSALQHPPSHPAGQVWPRALFGLPIVFHFKDKKAGDPSDHTLYPIGSQRMASPLILRPMRKPGSDAWFAGALLLPEIPIEGKPLRLHRQGGREISVDVGWPTDAQRCRELAQKIRPIADTQQTHPLDAFLEFFERRPAVQATKGQR